ncbi:MAG: 6-pyruvoyl tetrahydrobiopterin synthase [Lachnospiraceae bacterium]|nr:6-pyruvoyl tetrahydrobiopterin synthase [Lachnospiraceae bacterium]
MLYRQYKYKFYLNMNHSVEMEGRMGEIHSHTWEISMGIALAQEGFVRFSDIEKQVNEMLEVYQDKYLNEMPPFNMMNPTVENMCNYLYEKISEKLRESGWLLLIMEISETPSRVYQVSSINPRNDYTFI